MPRKLYRLQEVPPSSERPGSGTPEKSSHNEALERMRESKRRVAEQREEVKKEIRRRREEPVVSMKEMSEAEEAALGEELESELESSTDRLIEAEDRLRANPSVENAKEVERIREEAQEIYLAKHEVKPEPVPVMKPEPIERREPRTAEQEEMTRAMTGGVDRERAQMEKQNQLLGERDDLKQRMEEMGGVWGGEAYFLLNDRLREVEGELVKMGYPVEAPRGKVLSEAKEEAAGPTPEDKIADARKAMKFISDAEKEVAARQKKMQKELAKHGLTTPARIAEKLNEIEEEIRAAAAGEKPSVWHRMKALGRRLAGSELTPAAKELLKKYVDLESEMNGYIRERNEAQALLEAAEREAGRVRMPRARGMGRGRETMSGIRGGVADISGGGGLEGFATTFLEAPEAYRGGKELQATMALKKIEEDIRTALGEMEAMKELTETEISEEMFEEKKSNFAKRIRALEEAGRGPEFDQSLEDAEEALMRYVMAVHKRRQEFEEQARAAGKGEARPVSVIGMRAGTAGTYGTATPDRRVVRLQQLETPDTRARAAEQREAASAPERVNKDVEMYRSIKWRKNLIDKINANQEARRAMHGVYEAFKRRMLEKLANEEEVNFRTGSPDPALDYALDLYRYYARRPDGKGYVYERAIRLAAHAQIEDAEAVLGKNWDREGWGAQAVRAASLGKETLPVEESYEEFRAIEPVETEGAEVIPLPHVKRTMSEREQEAVEEAEIPSKVVVTAPQAEEEALAGASEEQRRIDREAEESFAASTSEEETEEMEFRPAARVLREEAEATAKGPTVERRRPYRTVETRVAEGSEPAWMENVRNKKVLKLREGQKLNMMDALNAKSLALTKKQRSRLEALLGQNWKQRYIETFDAYSQEPGATDEAIEARRILEEANDILSVQNPMDLLAGESPEVRRALSAAEQEQKRVQQKGQKPGKRTSVASTKAQPTAKAPGILTMSQIQEGIARKKAVEAPTGIPPALEETPPSNVRSLEEARRKKQGRKK